MKLKGFISRYLGYSRSERTGSLVLVFIVFVILAASLLREGRSGEKNFTTRNISDSCASDTVSSAEAVYATYFLFDPNLISYDSLLLLGLGSKNAGTLINYRNSGARFRRPSDIKKVYGLEGELGDSLLPYIRITASRSSAVADARPGPSNSMGGHVRIAAAVDSSRQEVKKEPGYSLCLDINSADSAELRQLPGIGSVLGARIVKYRKLLGGYVSVAQLAEVYGIDSVLVTKLSPYTYADTTLISPIYLNYADFSELLRHPYFDHKLCTDIFYYRRLSGRIDSLGELVRNRITDHSTLAKISPYITLSDTSSH